MPNSQDSNIHFDAGPHNQNCSKESDPVFNRKLADEDVDSLRIDIIERILTVKKFAIENVLLSSVKEMRGIDYGMGIRCGIRFSGFDVSPYSVVCANVNTSKAGAWLSKPIPVLVGFGKRNIAVVTNAILTTVLIEAPFERVRVFELIE
jgi:hypothetical protein